MLEVKNLTKVYAGKGGVEVRALDDVSVPFPEKGMVFLLGKSGSGKSTLLNVAGGLDKPDGGEILVKGRSSKDFSGADFDSYRNTFIGFVFQEYNILNEFTIEQNIALALQLQNKPNDKKAVADLLEQVDLKGYGKRKPNTLSGGQKQRVAIARALIKQPEIIMADEPTGALDSNTGKQVLDTLKKLSETKLVIVVSHDREFAEFYGDRIIELKDGKIRSDVSKTYIEPENSDENVVVMDDTIRVKDSAAITDAEIKKIAEVLKKKGGEAIIAAGERELKDVKRACKINDDGSKESFKQTDAVETKAYNGKETKFIKSRLPMGHAIKMGASGLKSKPIRLIFTILLSVAAFVMFGVASTFMLYDSNYSISKALKEANYPMITLSKSYKVMCEQIRTDSSGNEEVMDHDTDYVTTLFGASEVGSKSKDGLKFAGVFDFSDNSYYDHSDYTLDLVSGDSYIPVSVGSDHRSFYSVTTALGFSDCGAEYLSSVGYRLIGEYPSAKNEIALPEYLAELFAETEGANVNSVSDLIGKTIRLSGGRDIFRGEDSKFTIKGIVSVESIPFKFDVLKTSPNSISEENREKLKSSFQDYLRNSFNTVIFVGASFYDAYKDRMPKNRNMRNLDGRYFKSIRFSNERNDRDLEQWEGETIFTDRFCNNHKSEIVFYAPNGTVIAEPSFEDGKIYLNISAYREMLKNALANYFNRCRDNALFDPEARALFNDDLTNAFWDSTDPAPYVGYVQTWFQKLMYRKYLYEAASILRNNGYYTENFSAAYEKIQYYVNMSESATEPTAADWAAIEAVVSSDFKTDYLQTVYGLIVDYYWNVNESIFDNDIIWNVIDSLKNRRCGEDEFREYKAAVDAFLAGKGKSVDEIDKVFACDVDSFVRTLWFRDKYNVSGTLEIAGYFDSSVANLGSYYAISESWTEAHATMNQDGGYHWSMSYKTDYVRPDDAKYNLIFSPTDNSQAQITSALKGGDNVKYDVESRVYEQLEMFLSMIKMLQKIFLIVGLVVGAIAALFLLNFIAVSISAKRKDIGILRAVGARGSDVFKIFYAEAFIIAFICFILASVGSFVVCFFLNRSLVDAVSMQLLNFGPINVALIFGVSIFVSVLATFLPVFFAAKKSPVESIRAL